MELEKRSEINNKREKRGKRRYLHEESEGPRFRTKKGRKNMICTS